MSIDLFVSTDQLEPALLNPNLRIIGSPEMWWQAARQALLLSKQTLVSMETETNKIQMPKLVPDQDSRWQTLVGVITNPTRWGRYLLKAGSHVND